MLHELLLLGHTYNNLPNTLSSSYPIDSTHIENFTTIKDLITYLFSITKYSLVKSNTTDKIIRNNISDNEKELDYSVTVIINTNYSYYSTISNSSNDSLNNLSLDSLLSLIGYRFLNLNPIILCVSSNSAIDSTATSSLTIVENNISTRLTRVKCWIGFNSNNFEHLDTMINYLNLKFPTEDTLQLFNNLLSKDINYEDLLNNLQKSDEEYLDLLNKWDFNAFQFNQDELLQIGFLILNAYNTDKSQISINNIKSFIFFIRDNYRIGNPFHNFRHAIDVLQATNYFLNQLIKHSNFKISSIDSFSLLLASLGHDIGHPGITNQFLINTKSPLATEFNNISILENFHKFQFSEILIPFLDQNLHYFNSNKSTEIIYSILDLIDNSILATDMALHDEFVNKIDKLGTDYDNFKLLACILIKSADISNVCRYLNSSCKWGLSLGEEFKQIACLENYFKDTSNTSLLNDKLIENNFGKQIKDIDINESVKLVTNLNKNQLFFINRFAKDFFNKVGDTIPQLKFLSDILSDNAKYWESV